MNKNKKYKLTKDTLQTYNTATLYRIQALREFDGGWVDELGGYVASESNLSHEGDAWISENAIVRDYAQINGKAIIRGQAIVEKNAIVRDYAVVNGNAKISENAIVRDNAFISGNARISGNAVVSGKARIGGKAVVRDNAVVSGIAVVSGEAVVEGNVIIRGDALILKTSDYLHMGPMGSRNAYTTVYKTEGGGIGVSCGCFTGTLDEFEAKVRETHGSNKHGRDYMALIAWARARWGCTDL